MSSPAGTTYNRDTDPVINRQPTPRPRCWRLLLAAVAAALVTLFGATTASAATLPNLETRVGASTPTVVYVVGVHESITAGQRWCNAPPRADSVVATGVAPEAGASALPTLMGSNAESFEGGAYATRTFKAGTEFSRAEAWGASAPGRFLGTEAVSTRAEAEPADNIVKWGNPSEVMRRYRLTEDATMYNGRVAGGEGYQALIPRGVDPGAVLRQVDARALG